MKSQVEHWNTVHSKGSIDHYSDKPTRFAEEVLQLISPSSSILELGCGAGNDSIAFVRNGHSVLATDFSDVAVQKCTQRFTNTPNLSFETLDISHPINHSDNSFDLVYARLSLHYFTDQKTHAAFNEIHRVVNPGGYLCFMCKSTEDSLYGLGEEIEKDMFEYKGHVRHFFSKEYAIKLIGNRFTPLIIKTGNEVFYDKNSSYIKVIAKTSKS